VREILQAKEKSDLVAVAAVDDTFSQGWEVEQVDDAREVIRSSIVWNGNVEERQSWDVKPVRVRAHVVDVEAQMYQQGALRRDRGQVVIIWATVFEVRQGGRPHRHR
jgi:hypothetical protein